jgi:hypothetical protein
LGTKKVLTSAGTSKLERDTHVIETKGELLSGRILNIYIIYMHMIKVLNSIKRSIEVTL